MLGRRALGSLLQGVAAAARGSSGAAPAGSGAALLDAQRCACLLPALSAHTTAHTYHGGGVGDGDGESEGDARAAEVEAVRRLRAAAERAGAGAGGGAPVRRPQPPLPESAARRAMLDPLGLLMAARSVPLGISLKVDRAVAAAAGLESEQQAQQPHDAQGQGQDQQQRQRAQQEAGLAAAAAAPQPRQDRGRRRAAPRSVAAAAAAATAAPATSAPTDMAVASAARLASDPARALEQLEHLLASASEAAGERDSWGTTTQSAADIAQRIAESNLAAGGGGEGGGDGDGASSDDEGAQEDAGGPFVTPEQVGKDLKELDEVFAILAQVPWLDDGSVDERELRGVVAFGLLGTLEEVGWELRDGVAAIWGGERDAEALAARAADARQAAALSAVLYHTRKLEAEYGPPPQESAALAVAAAEAGGDPTARQQQTEQAAQQQRSDDARGRRRPA
ncbi:hypothetical protein Rsub_07726 [Raphidocelis subcapitata]|uniref:Uncharacterized protein n=1 Tax=Raphidocelis subcapitata TaxID=307507 RepID=A0A2V0P874_9CHLO|nr:hypothetical protein Rsub_07726 [Raphidocelis subcapitata]|eukprot:GBF95142.1 hypothetical protein Rsub_07726 [Raphidocelis subcapitata]